MENRDKATFPAICPEEFKEAEGLTKLEYFTAKAMQGLLSHFNPRGMSINGRKMNIDKASVYIAKATLQALSTEKTKENK